jgi:hypothetical protein
MFLNGNSARSRWRHFGDQRDDQENDQRCPVLLRALTAILSLGKKLRPKVCLLAPFYREEMPSFDTIDELPKSDERSDVEFVGARFIAPAGWSEANTPNSPTISIYRG